MFGFPCWKSSNPKVIRIKTYLCENFCQIKAPELIPGDLFRVKIREKMGNYTLFQMFENPRRGQQARNFTTNVPKIVDLKSSSEQIFSKKWHCVPCGTWRTRTPAFYSYQSFRSIPMNACQFLWWTFADVGKQQQHIWQISKKRSVSRKV